MAAGDRTAAGSRPAHRPYEPPPRHPPLHTVGAIAVGALGGLAALFVLAIVTFSVADREPKPGRVVDDLKTGSREAAINSPLYRSGALTPDHCRMPALHAHDEASMHAFLDTLSDCLDTAWRRQFSAAGVAGFEAPERVFWTSSGSSPCGSYPAPGASAFYCPSNDTMYVGLADVVDEPVSHYAVYARVIAHEYGHHVQEDAGILEYGHRLMADGDTAARNETSRRIELQAQCLAGAFLATQRLPRAQYREMIRDAEERGDDHEPPHRQDHGSDKNYAGWVARGYTQQALAACNTWTASSPDVS